MIRTSPVQSRSQLSRYHDLHEQNVLLYVLYSFSTQNLHLADMLPLTESGGKLTFAQPGLPIYCSLPSIQQLVNELLD